MNLMQYDCKSRKNTNRNHSRAKQAHANTVDPATHLKDTQHMGRDTQDVIR